jgi:O-antigen/teichoic acid export membrane protein
MLTKTARKPRQPSRQPTRASSPDDERKLENRAVRRGFSWLAAGNIVNAACAWGRVALLARLGNAEMIGQLTLALALCSPIGSLADLGLSGSLISDANRQYRLRDYLVLRLLACGLAMFAIVVTAWAGGYDPATARLVVLAGLIVVSESVCELFQAVLQRREQMRWVAISLMVRGLLGLSFFALGTWFSGGLAWGVCGFSLAALTTLLTIDIPRAMACEQAQDDVCDHTNPKRQRGRELASALTPRVSRNHKRDEGAIPVLDEELEMVGRRSLRDLVRPYHCPQSSLGRSASVLLGLAWLSLPLGLATAGLSLMNSLPRYWISSRLGIEALGGFAVAGSLMVAISLVVGAMSQAASPRLARYHAAGNTDALLRLLRGLGLWLAAIMVVSLLVMAVAGRWLIGLLFGPAYISLANVALCLMMAAGLRNFSIFLGRAISSMRQFRTSLLLRAVGVAALVLLLPGWIDWLGLMGAAWAVTLSWLFTVLLSLAAVLREVRRCQRAAECDPMIYLATNGTRMEHGQIGN